MGFLYDDSRQKLKAESVSQPDHTEKYSVFQYIMIVLIMIREIQCFGKISCNQEVFFFVSIGNCWVITYT